MAIGPSNGARWSPGDSEPRPCPEGPSTQCLRTLVPKAIKGMVVGTRVLKYWVLGPSGLGFIVYYPKRTTFEPVGGDSYVVPFWLCLLFLIRDYNLLPKKELHQSLLVGELGSAPSPRA